MTAPCSISCAISAVFIIGMIYMTNATSTNKTIQKYQEQLPQNLKTLYEKIVKERTAIYYQGYILGFIISLFVILYSRKHMSSTSVVCTVIAISFLTNYFYYTLAPKTNWMLDSIKTPEQTKAWLKMYRNMQVYYHGGLVLGIVAVAIFAFAFRC